VIVVDIGVVAEGKTDQLVIKELVNIYFKTQEILCQINFKSEQPTADNTSGGGWRSVHQWCLNNTAVERKARYFEGGLFESDNTRCDALLIHLDSDICEQILLSESSACTELKLEDPVERGNYIKRNLDKWLWSTDVDRHGWYIIAPAVEAIESWLVAGLSDEINCNPESKSIQEITKLLAELYYFKIDKPLPKDIKALRKTEEQYRKILDIAHVNIGKIVDTCPHFKELVEEVAKIVNQKMALGYV
jgi:hypothetical protein